MANLGFQADFHIFDAAPRVAADRAFLPDADERAALRDRQAPLLSLEQGRPLSDFEIIAFSISFETDYLNLISILRMAGIPPRRADRRGRNYPLIIAGGSAIFLNPEPIADFIDLFLIGEGEEMVPEFLDRLSKVARMRTAARRAPMHGSRASKAPTCPTISSPLLMMLADMRSSAIAVPVCRSVKRPADRRPRPLYYLLADPHRRIGLWRHVPGRGQPWMPMGMPLLRRRLYVPSDSLSQSGTSDGRSAVADCRERKVIGLVGAEIASVPGVAGIAQAVADSGGRLSPSSLKADCISPELASALARNGNRSVTIAPEAGSERMRKVINKNLTETEILNAAEMLIGGGVENLKAYFMIGLPEEQDADVREVARLTGRILDRARSSKRHVGHVTVSLNPFVPKPWTPFQWDPMEDAAALKRKVALVRAELGRIGGGAIDLDAESPREAYFQTLVSRGDRRVGGILERLSATWLRRTRRDLA